MKTFLDPDTMVKAPNSDRLVKDESASEEFRLLEAPGTPKVFYAVKANKYFKDAGCKNPFTSAEITALGLATEIEISTARTRLLKAAADAGQDISTLEVARATAPQKLGAAPGYRDGKQTLDQILADRNKIS